jgi:CRISPR-associated protein Csy1
VSRASADAALDRARARLAAGDIAGARRDCAPLLTRGDPSEAAAAHLLLSACATRAGDAAGARRHVESALRLNADDAFAHFAAAELAERAGDPVAAIGSLERAVALQPAFVAAQQLLGILYGERGEAARAADAFAHVVALDPRNARGFNNLGNALRALDRADDATAAFERAVALQPDYDLAVANLAAMRRDAGDASRAEQLLRDALARRSGKPPMRAMIVMLAGLLHDRNALDDAEPLYRQAIAAAPTASAGEWFRLGRLLAERDETVRAREAFRKSFELEPKDFRGALAARLTLPMICEDAAAVTKARGEFRQGLNELHAMADRLVTGLAPAQVLDGLRWTNFFLAYQGGDDRDLQAAYAALAARMIERGAPAWRAPIERREFRGRRLRVGFASAFFHDGTAGRYFRSWLTDLDRDRFDVHVYHLFPGVDDVASEIKARADRFVEFAGSRARPSIVAPVIRDDALDVLVYPELGMDHTSFALAALRLAPRQLAGWGHPVTSGHATIDGFISCDAMEPPGAEGHYVEPLLRLPGIGTRYRRPAVPQRLPRAQFGLPDDRVLLLCPQSLFKVHPDNDRLFARVLEENPAATLVMFEGRHANVTGRFIQRMTRAFEHFGLSVRDRTIVLPSLPHDDYLRVNLVCDAVLDTLHWSGGNTSLDALACGVPVVTLPGAFMRGRQSAAMLRQAGADATIAGNEDDYVRLASRIVDDPAWRAGMAETIRSGRDALFDRHEPVEAFSRLLLELR